MSPATMSNADAAWLHMDRPVNLMVINAVMWTEDPVRVERVKDICRRRLVEPFPRFRQRVVESRLPGGVPHWEACDDFDIDAHVHHIALPAPGDRAALQELASDLITAPLDRSKPLWQFYVIDGYEGGSAILTRIHHCVADGIALARVLLSLTDDEPDAGIAPVDDGGGGRRRRLRVDPLLGPARSMVGATRAAASAVVHEGWEIARHPTEALSLAAAARSDVEAAAKVVLARSDADTVLKGELGVAKRVAWSRPRPLSDVKEVAHAAGATINDVLVAAVAGALRDYLRRRDSLVDEVHVMVPFNLRPLDEPLPAELGNDFGLVLLPLPVGIRGTRARLVEVKRSMDEIKDSPQGSVAYAILAMIGMTPVQVEKAMVDMFSAKASAVVTNVPGPREPVWFAGTPVRGVLVWAPTSGSVAMSVALFSYAGEVTVGFFVDAHLVPDPDRIARGFERELEHVGRLYGVAPAERAGP